MQEIIRRILHHDPTADIRVEYMDTRHHQSPEYLRHLYEHLELKFLNTTFDLLITLDDAAFEFMCEHHDTIFPKTPAVFAGVNSLDSVVNKKIPWFTGVVERHATENVVGLMHALHPKAKRLHIIYDNKQTSRDELVREFPNFMNFGHWQIQTLLGDRLNTEALIDSLQKIHPEDLVFFGSWELDADSVALSYAQAAKMVSENCAAPIYTMSLQYMGHGITGGHILRGVDHGQIAGELVIRILQGEHPASIPFYNQPQGTFIFDCRRLKRFNIHPKQLPPGSEILFEPVSFFSQHRSVILIALGIILSQATLIGFLILNAKHRRRVEMRLAFEEQLLRLLMDNIPDSIYFKDIRARFIRNNRAHLNYLGVTHQDEAMGKTDFDFQPEPHAKRAFQDEMEIVRTGKPIIDKQEEIHWENGVTQWLSTTKVPLRQNGKIKMIVGVSREITMRKKAEDLLRKSLTEKECLLKEIHHRVKNNLQIISSLLSLQASTLSDMQTIAIFKESQDRVRSMALIHETLYQSHDLACIDFRDYAGKLVNTLSRSHNLTSEKIDIELNISEVLLDINTAVPCGLILNELISNSLKHAFPSGKIARPKIDIDFLSVEDEVRMVVKDNGVGMRHAIDFQTTSSLGLRLVKLLVESQLQGRVRAENKDGLTFHIQFNLNRDVEK